MGCAKVVAPLGVGGELTGKIAITACVLGRLRTTRGNDTLITRGPDERKGDTRSVAVTQPEFSICRTKRGDSSGILLLDG